MLERISAQLSESQASVEETGGKKLRLDDLESLIKAADRLGYSVENASDMKSPQDDISCELYAAWYAKENGICIFEDNIPHLIEFTGWPHLESNLKETQVA